MPLRSGPIRQSIATSLRYLVQRVQRSTDLLRVAIPQTAEECQDAIDSLTEARELIESSIKNIEKKDTEWQTLIQETEDEAISKDEQVQYDIIAGAPATGYLIALNDAQTAIGAISTRIRKLNRSITTLSGDPSSLSVGARGSSDAQQLHASVSRVKTPKIVLPFFEGDILKWKEFWSIYSCTIHNRSDFSAVEKFTYLLPQLTGRAKQSIDGLLITDESYEAAIAILKKRFDRSDDRIISILYGELKQLPRCGTSCDDKRNTYDKCERIFRQLKLAGEDIDSTKALTIDFLSKFPSAMIRDLQRHYSVGVHSSLSDARTGVEKSISELELTSGVLEDLDAISGLSVKSKPPNGYGKRQNGSDSGHQNNSSPDESQEIHNSAFASVSETGGVSRGLTNTSSTAPSSDCYFCGGKHFNGDCTKYTTAKGREQRLYDLKRCIKCGRKHNAGGKRSQCNNPQVKCVHCKTKDNHYSALCRVHFPSSEDSKASNTSREQACVAVDHGSDVTILNNSAARNTLFQTAKVAIVNPETGDTATLRLCLDSLSNRSYITDRAADILHLSSCRSDCLRVSVFGSQKSIEVPSRLVQFGVVEADGSVRKIEANTTRIISNTNVLPKCWPQRETSLLKSMERSHTLADDPFDDDRSVDVLVGADYVWEFITGSKINTDTGIYFIPSTLGLMLAGQLKFDDDYTGDEPSTMLCITETSQQHDLALLSSSSETRFQPNYPDIDEYWKLETIGITDCPVEDEDEKALDSFHKTVYYEDGRYHVTWPWIEEKRCLLPPNLNVALRRFKSLSTRLALNKDLLQGYRDVLQVQLDRGIIEKVPTNEVDVPGTIHYLPHHPVVKLSSTTTKIRIVYDASSKLRKTDVSLNECLLRGPVILPDLCQLLMRFRVHKIAIVSDIEKAFLQVALEPSQRDITRFLWYEDDKRPDIVTDNIAIYRFCRVAFGVISSPFLLGATIQHHLLVQSTPFATDLMNDIYVDNVISGVEDDHESIEYHQKVKSMFDSAGMNLQEFCSNSKALMDSIPVVDRVKTTDVKVLGVKWDSQNDDSIRITPSPKWNLDSATPSKRTVLQAIASIFDPLGLFQPVLFPAKLFLQKLWQLEMPWDSVLSNDLKNEWDLIVSSVCDIFDYRIPRYVGNVTATSTIMVFSDASAKGYGVAVYIRCINQSNTWVSNLLFAKSRLAPMPNNPKGENTSQITIPRLELLGATIAATAAEFCRNAFGLHQMKVHFFIDSECVLQWIRSKHLLKRFVAHRIEKIRSIENCVFHYVDTADNPADYLTRGKTAAELCNEPKWWHGPVWLTMKESEWPETRLESTSDEVLRNILAETKTVDICHVANEEQPTTTKPETKGLFGIDPTTFSSFQRLMRITAVCLKFLKRHVWNRLSAQSQHNANLISIFDRVSDETTITASDIDLTTERWIRHIQSTAFKELFDALRANKKLAIISQLNLQLDSEGMIRSCSRFANADLPDATKFPLLLPKNNRFTELVVTDVHINKLRHGGIPHTLSEVRQRYWIPQGRSFVTKVLRRCFVCKLFKTAVPFALPDMPPWPLERVTRSTPFQFCGVDYFGPIKVRNGESIEKMWGCLFTCLATRAVHLEPVADCTPVEFLNSLIRFVSRRGCPQKIISDNAAQFQLMKILNDRAWKRTPNDETILSYSAHSAIEWKFIIELAPWQGGHYERLVGVVKAVLKTAIGRRLLTWTDFITLLTETEAIVNCRPITYIGNDIDSQIRALRPIDFLISQPAGIAATEGDFPIRDLGDSGKRLAAIWKQRKRHLDKLWHNWYDEYLLSLRERGNSVHRSGRGHVSRSPRIGEVVLLHDKNLPRGSWRLARIIRLIISADSDVRAAEIKLSNGIKLRRAVNCLLPLEVDNEYEVDNGGEMATLRGESVGAAESDEIQRENTERDNDDDGDFFGFSPEEVQRAIDAVQRLPGSSTEA